MEEQKPFELPQRQPQEAELVGFWANHRFLLLVIGTIVISIMLVIVSLVIYNVSGSAQLDLSRPGYQSVSQQVERSDTAQGFSANGDVNMGTIDEFLRLYDQQAKKAKAIDAFNGDPLNPETLEFSTGTAAQ